MKLWKWTEKDKVNEEFKEPQNVDGFVILNNAATATATYGFYNEIVKMDRKG